MFRTVVVLAALGLGLVGGVTAVSADEGNTVHVPCGGGSLGCVPATPHETVLRARPGVFVSLFRPSAPLPPERDYSTATSRHTGAGR